MSRVGWALLIALWIVTIIWARSAEAQSRVEWQEVSESLPPASVELVPIRGADHVAELRIVNEVNHPSGTVIATLEVGAIAVDIEIDVSDHLAADLFLFEVAPGFVLERRSLSLPDRERAVLRIWAVDANMM